MLFLIVYLIKILEAKESNYLHFFLGKTLPMNRHGRAVRGTWYLAPIPFADLNRLHFSMCIDINLFIDELHIEQ
jgi:hypothetical protein